MRYSTLTKLYEDLKKTTKRLEKTSLIADFLRVNKDEIKDMVLLLLGRIYPRWNRTELGISTKLVIKALSITSGKSPTEIEGSWKKTGDLGDTTALLLAKKQQMSLFSQDITTAELLTDLRKIAEIEGPGSTDTKIKILAKLLGAAKPEEARYIIRTVLEDMRTGANEGVIRDAIVYAMPEIKEHGFDKETSTLGHTTEPGKHLKELKIVVENAINLTNDLPKVAKIAISEGLEGLKKIKTEIGKPINVMLFPKAADIKEAFSSLSADKSQPEQLAFEYKYDGFRVQIHKKGDIVRLFTRRLDEVTEQFPDVQEAVRKHVKAQRCILDAEVVGYDKDTGNYLPFQSISQRIKRKHNIKEIAERFPVEINLFDIIQEGDRSLLSKEFLKRRKELARTIDEKDKTIVLSRQIITDDEKEAEDFYKRSLSEGFEGIMAKALRAPYKAGRRVGAGFKLKPVMEELDLVITGAEWGTGKRGKWITSYTVSCYDETDELVEIGKVSSGLKELEDDEGSPTYSKMTTLLEPLIISEEGKDIKVKPEIIIEVHYEEIQKSPSYSSGYALRFPRIVRLRDDKSLDEIATIQQIDVLFKKQKR